MAGQTDCKHLGSKTTHVSPRGICRLMHAIACHCHRQACRGFFLAFPMLDTVVRTKRHGRTCLSFLLLVREKDPNDVAFCRP